MFAVAHALGKYPHEIARDMTVFEMEMFCAYLDILKDQQQC